MKLRNCLPVAALLCFALVIGAHAQFNITGKIKGRAVTSNGTGIGKTRVSLMDLTTLEPQYALTNNFGYFQFENLPIGHLYFVSVNSKTSLFTFSYQTVELFVLEYTMTFVSDEFRVTDILKN